MKRTAFGSGLNIQDGPSSGFAPVFAPSQARRQLRVSLVILAAVVTATFSAALTGNLKPIHAERAPVTLTYQQPGTSLTQKAQAVPVQAQTARPRG